MKKDAREKALGKSYRNMAKSKIASKEAAKNKKEAEKLLFYLNISIPGILGMPSFATAASSASFTFVAVSIAINIRFLIYPFLFNYTP